jgi:hypothetical protein
VLAREKVSWERDRVREEREDIKKEIMRIVRDDLRKDSKKECEIKQREREWVRKRVGEKDRV